MFQIGETVIHPGYGPGRVIDIEKLVCLGSDKRYYSIKLLDGTDTRVWVAVKDVEKVGIRHPVSSDQVDQVWFCLRSQPHDLPSDHNERYQIVRNKLETGDLVCIAEAIRDLSWKNHSVRNLTSEGKRLYDKGIKLLATEVAVVRGSDTEAVEVELMRVLSENVATWELA